jgi:hypothetical protein
VFAAMQKRNTEITAQAERALAAALQGQAESLGLSAWSGQVFANGRGKDWFGGVELRSSEINAALLSSMDLQEIEEGLSRIVVRIQPLSRPEHLISCCYIFSEG